MITTIHSAPLQGYTDRAWRTAHAEIYGGIATYYTPFIRVDKGAMRNRDIRELADPDIATNVIPQIIFNSIEEFDMLVAAIAELGCHHIDLNFGCPFPPQVKHGRGAGALRVPLLEEIEDAMRVRYRDMTFSMKMRLGVNAPDEWQSVIDIIDNMPLSHITVHPRVARQQYSGEINMDMFMQICVRTSHAVIYNGDICSLEDMARINIEAGDVVDNIMIGRGLLSRPSLAVEYHEGKWSEEKRIMCLRRFHDLIYSNYCDTLCGDAQILSKIKPMWEWLENEVGHKACKNIRKSTTLAKYENAVANAIGM